MEIGGKLLQCQLANAGPRIGGIPGLGDESMGVGGVAPVAAVLAGAAQPSEVLVLLNMVANEDLADDEEYEDILLDIREECEKFGAVVDVKIPRPTPGGGDVPGLGKCFVHFRTAADAAAAQAALAGRKFGDNTVVTSYITLPDFQAGRF